MKLSLVVNHNCNLACSYCYTGRKYDRPLSDETARKGVDLGFSLADKGALLLSFFGGEPLLEPDLIDRAATYAVERAEELDLVVGFQLSTNGSLVDDHRVSVLKKHGIKLQVSYDGCAGAQDANRRFRGGGSSAATVEEGLGRLVHEGLCSQVVTVISPENAEFLPESFEHLEKIGVKRWVLSPHYGDGWDDEARDRLEEGFLNLADLYTASLVAKKPMRIATLDTKIYARVRGGLTERGRCSMGLREMAVAPSGRIYPCDRMVHEDEDTAYCIGSVDEGIDVQKRDHLLNKARAVDEECEACEDNNRCMHWCGCANIETTGDPGKVSPLVCWFQRCTFRAADRVGKELFSKDEQHFIKRYVGIRNGK